MDITMVIYSVKTWSQVDLCLKMVAAVEIAGFSKYLHNMTSKTIPTGIIWAGNNRFSIPIWNSIWIFTPLSEGKRYTGALKQGCNMQKFNQVFILEFSVANLPH